MEISPDTTGRAKKTRNRRLGRLAEIYPAELEAGPSVYGTADVTGCAAVLYPTRSQGDPPGSE
jgi:hypothetical protein